MSIQVLLAIYNPNIEYLTKQLTSINNQTLKDFEVVCCDDCSSNYNNIYDTLSEVLTNVKWTYIRNDVNIGCNKTFEKLIAASSSKFLAFSDQDDIWHSDKLLLQYKTIEETAALLVYSDLQLIDEDDRITSSTVRNERRRLSHLSGEGLWPRFLRMNSITGCTILIRGDLAKAALPFPLETIYIWDQWVAIWASFNGLIHYYSKPLVSYRIHSNNLVGINKLSNINDKASYITNRINYEIASLQFAYTRLYMDAQTKDVISAKIDDVLQRKKMILNPLSGINKISVKLFFDDPLLFLFELFLSLCPFNGTYLLKFVKISKF